MNSLRSLSVATLLLVFSGASAAQSPPLSFDAAQWIWPPSATRPDEPVAPGVCYFRAELNLPRDCDIMAAEVIATVDNAFVLYVNGQAVGESGTDSSAWEVPQRLDIAKALVPGRNVFALKAVNTQPGPAGALIAAAVRLADGIVVTLHSDAAWKCRLTEQPNWQQHAFEDGKWSAVSVIGRYGDVPWRKLSVPTGPQPIGQPAGEVDRVAANLLRQATKLAETTVVEQTPAAEFPWPDGIIFVGDDCSLYLTDGATNTSLDSLNVTIFNSKRSRAFPEHDLPSPMKVGRKLYAVQPARPGITPRLVLDAGKGALGSPSVTFDGTASLFGRTREDDRFFHIYRSTFSGDQWQ